MGTTPKEDKSASELNGRGLAKWHYARIPQPKIRRSPNESQPEDQACPEFPCWRYSHRESPFQTVAVLAARREQATFSLEPYGQDVSSDSRLFKPFKSFQATQDLNFKLSAFKTTLRSTVQGIHADPRRQTGIHRCEYTGTERAYGIIP